MHLRCHLRTLLVAGIVLAGAQIRAQDGAAGGIPDDSPARDALLRAKAVGDGIVAISDDARTFDNTIAAVDDLLAQLEIDTNMMMFMAYVSTDGAERSRGERAEEDVTNWLIDLTKREDLYHAVKAYADTRPALEGEDKRLLEHTLRDYRRAGMELPADRRRKLTEAQKEITRLSIEFERNIREDESRVPLTRAELAGMSDDYIASLEPKRSGDVFLVGLSYPEFVPILDFCEDEMTRNKMWLAYKRRGGRKNVRVLEQILALRAEAASLLGYAHPADYEIEVRMAA